jgi:hypothetical protein
MLMHEITSALIAYVVVALLPYDHDDDELSIYGDYLYYI